MHRLVATSLSDQVDALRSRRRLSQWLLLLVVVALVLLFTDWFDTNEADKLPLALQRIRQLGFVVGALARWLPPQAGLQR
jgi:hypothetical protein